MSLILWRYGFLLALCLLGLFHAALFPAATLSAPSDFSFAGNWDCEGKFGNGRAHRALYHGEVSADDKWIELSERDTEPKGYVGRYELGKDPAADKLIFLDINTAGYAVFESPGWQDKTLVVTSTEVHYAHPSPKNRFLYTVIDKLHFDVEWQYQKDAGWISSDLLHCTLTDSKPKATNREPL